MNFVAVGLALAIFSSGDDVLRVEIQHRRPSKIVEHLTQMRSLTPPTVAIEAKDEQGVLELRGPTNDVETIKDLIHLFDVAAKKVRFDYEVNSPLDKLTFNGSVSASNNQSFGISEGELGFAAKFTPRINDDETITVRFELSIGRGKIETVMRVKNGSTVILPLGEKSVSADKLQVKVKVSL